MQKLIAAERQHQIIELLNSNRSMNILELAKRFQVSKETIRRDLVYLTEKGLVKKTHGGVVAIDDYQLDTTSLESRIDTNQPLKFKLCQKALEFLPPHAVIFLDTGSTIHCLAQLLGQLSNYTIVTNSLNAANILVKSSNQTFITGGQINSVTMAVDGLQTIDFISKIKVDIAFLGTNGFERHNGPSSTDFSDVLTKQTIIQNAKINIVISESRKSTYSALVQYTSWRNIDYFITDSHLHQEVQEELDDMTKVILVDYSDIK